MNPIYLHNTVPQGLPPTASTGTQAPTDATSAFKKFLLESIDHVNTMQQDADRAVQQLATGGDVDTAEVLTSIQKVDLTFRMMLQIRNKLVQAYQEINQIRI